MRRGARGLPGEEQRPDGVVLRRSARRRRTAAARLEDGRPVVLLPAGLTPRAEEHLVSDVLQRLERSRRRRTPGDAELAARAARLSDAHLGGRARPTSVRWARQERRWGSASPASGELRLSRRLQGAPTWVLDSVLLHELAHLLQPDHGPAFHRLLAADPHRARADAWLAGWEAGRAAATCATSGPADERDADEVGLGIGDDLTVIDHSPDAGGHRVL